jgi:hypothetical protein
MLLLGVLQAQAAGQVAAGSFDLLETQVLTSSAASVTFSSLSTYAADYQHLQIRVAGKTTRNLGGGNLSVRFNGDSAGNYSTHGIIGTGSSVVSFGAANQTSMLCGWLSSNTTAADVFGAAVIDILDPFETTKYPTIRTLSGQASGENQVRFESGSWRNTAALTSMTLFEGNGFNLSTGSRFSLYGIRGG